MHFSSTEPRPVTDISFHPFAETGMMVEVELNKHRNRNPTHYGIKWRPKSNDSSNEWNSEVVEFASGRTVRFQLSTIMKQSVQITAGSIASPEEMRLNVN